MTRTLHTLWQATVRRHAERPALYSGTEGTAFTFAELARRAEAWASRHLAGREDALRSRAVVFAAPNGPGWFDLFLALISRGAVVVPVDASEPLASQRRLAAGLRAAFVWNGGDLEALPSPRCFRDPAVRLIKLTSGSTGHPRALVFTDAQMEADGRQVAETMGMTSRDLNYALIPLGHSYGLGNLTLPLLARGVPLVCGGSPLPHAIAADFVRWRPTVFPGVPALWRALAASDVTLPGLRLAISAGAPLDPEVAAAFVHRFGLRLHSFYGSSETGGIAYDRSGRGALNGRVGTAMKHVMLTRLSRQRLRVASPAVTTVGNRLRVGQLGAWIVADRISVDPRGELTLLGRRGTTVKIAGRRLDLGEVSARLRRLTGVSDVWVGISQDREPILGAALATHRSTAELRAELVADTPLWKIPKKWVAIPSLPTTERGKIDSARLREVLFGPPSTEPRGHAGPGPRRR